MVVLLHVESVEAAVIILYAQAIVDDYRRKLASPRSRASRRQPRRLVVEARRRVRWGITRSRRRAGAWPAAVQIEEYV
jgi:hypothetical protein